MHRHIKTLRFISNLTSVWSCVGSRQLFHHPVMILARHGLAFHFTDTAKCFTTGRRLHVAADDGDFEESKKHRLAEVIPRLVMSYTCKVCNSSNSHTFSKKAYQEGVVIVQCISCKSNHLVADNLGWFKDVNKRNIEEIMAAKGEEVRRITDLDLPEDLLDKMKGRQDGRE